MTRGTGAPLTALLLTVVPFHRALLLAATVGIAISGARVANKPGEAAGWLVLAGASVLLVLADVCSDMNDRAESLAASARVKREAALRDLYQAEGPVRGRWGLPVGCVLLLFGIAAYVVGV